MFTFPLDPQALFHERSRQFAGWGIPWPVIRRMQARIRDCWDEAPGGWAYEWISEAREAERQKRFILAALLYGAARFPCITSPLRIQALQAQMTCFERGMHGLSLQVERRQVALTGPCALTMPVHLYSPRTGGEPPLVLLSGGVDTGKVELHRLACLLAQMGRFRVAAIDMPGTAESGLPLTADAHLTYQGLLNALAPNGRKAVVGVSFGGHWAAKLALLESVDAAVNLGGPTVVFESGSAFMRSLPNGMPGIIANTLGLPGMPEDAAMANFMRPFSLQAQGLLERQICAPMLVINGEHDQYIPQQDSMVLARYARNKIWLMRGMTHCAAEGLVRILPAIVAWLRVQLLGNTVGARLALSLAEWMLPGQLALPGLGASG